MDYLNYTLDELEGSVLAKSTTNLSKVIERVYYLRKRRIADFTVEDFRFMIAQRQGVKYLLPSVIKVLEADPFAEGDYYEGDLLLSTLRLECDFWLIHPTYAKRLNELVPKVRVMIDDVCIIDSIKLELLDQVQAFQNCIEKIK